MDILKLKNDELKKLKILSIKSADNAANSLSRWLGDKMSIKLFELCTPPLKEAASFVCNNDDKIISTVGRISGGIEGYLVFIFSNESALHLINKVFKKNNIKERANWDKLAISTIEETGNIVGTAFINKFASTLDISINLSILKFKKDYASAIIESIIIEDAMVSDHAFFFETEFFGTNEKIDGYLLLIPTPESVSFIVKEIS